MSFSKRKLHFLFFLFYVGDLKTEKRKKRKMEKAKKPCKNRVFLRWSCKTVKNKKKWIFCKNWLTLFVSGREKKTRIFVHTICFGQKIFLAQNSVNQEKL